MMNIRFNIVGDNSEDAREIERKIAAPFKHHALIPIIGTIVAYESKRYAVVGVTYKPKGAEIEIIVGIG
jgi:hypothetical protein